MSGGSVRIPFGDAFGPNQLTLDDDDACSLAVILELIEDHEGNPDEFEAEVADTFFEDSSVPGDRAENTRFGLGPRGYQLVDEEFTFTEIGVELSEMRSDTDELHDRFSEHILLNLNGLKVIEVVEDLPALGMTPTLENIIDALESEYNVEGRSDTTTDISQMRAWLNKSGIIGTGRDYSIDQAKVEELVGVSDEEILELYGLTDEQTAFLRALALVDPSEPIPHTKVSDIAEDAYGVEISGKRATTYVLDPLEEEGYISVTSRRGSPNLVEMTDRFEAQVLRPIFEHISERSGVPRDILRTSFEELEEQLDSDSKHGKGQALEALTVKVGYMLGLEFVGWHVRNWSGTGGSEVDVVMDSVGTAFSRWQIQCKNMANSLRTSDVKEEVGVSRLVQSNVILMIARSGVVDDARQYASRVTARGNLSIIFLNAEDLAEFDANPDKIVNTLRREARRVQRHKQIGARDMVEAVADESDRSEEAALEAHQEDLSEFVDEDG